MRGMDTPMDDPCDLGDIGEHSQGNINTAFKTFINCSTREVAIAAIDYRITAGEFSCGN
jgi:hypothetical protein